MPFQPGQSGNPGGRVKDRPFRDALRMALAADDFKALRKIAEALVAKAMEGEISAIMEVANRLDGKPLQPVEVGEPGEFDGKTMDDLVTEIRQKTAGLGLLVKPMAKGSTAH